MVPSSNVSHDSVDLGNTGYVNSLLPPGKIVLSKRVKLQEFTKIELACPNLAVAVCALDSLLVTITNLLRNVFVLYPVIFSQQILDFIQ